MKVLNTIINDLKIIKPKIFKDERGYFFESFNLKKYKSIISNNRFVQDDHSFSKKNYLEVLCYIVLRMCDAHKQWPKENVTGLYKICFCVPQE